MALEWHFKKHRIGTAITNKGNEITLYNGNAFVIALYETEKTYQLAWFFADEQHAKNCLGLTKGYEQNGFWESLEIKQLKLNVNFKETAKLINLLCKAKIEVEILLYNPPF